MQRSPDHPVVAVKKEVSSPLQQFEAGCKLRIVIEHAYLTCCVPKSVDTHSPPMLIMARTVLIDVVWNAPPALSLARHRRFLLACRESIAISDEFGGEPAPVARRGQLSLPPQLAHSNRRVDVPRCESRSSIDTWATRHLDSRREAD